MGCEWLCKTNLTFKPVSTFENYLAAERLCWGGSKSICFLVDSAWAVLKDRGMLR